ncbi:MAG TPA: XRE family transcriptional regulator [Gemmatimonadaceae bacterium]|jgi:Zn-dependent peptidase ImmA (M78 family)/DNA-binding Xre family transcriptional regulator
MTFSGARLRIGRLFHDLTQRDLAKKIAVSNSLIAAFESEVDPKEPRDDILDALCTVLEVEPEYFFQPATTDEFHESQSNFRKRIKASDRLKRQVLARASLFGMAVQHLRNFGTFPNFDYPNLPAASLDDVERVAEACRLHWKLGVDAPIGDMARVIENAGTVILSVDLKTAEHVDAFSRFGEISVVVLNTQKDSPSRTLFDMAHEVGHGIMHRTSRGLTLDKREAEADRFAGAFLMPRGAFETDFTASRGADWDGLLDMKRYWRVSIQAILRRAYQLQLIDAVEYRTRFRTLSGWGWRTTEPDEPTMDQPTLFQKALQRALVDYGKTPGDLARELGWKPTLFEKATGVPVPTTTTGRVISLLERRQAMA